MLFMVFNKSFKDFVLREIQLTCPPKKKTKYTNSYYYEMICYVLKDINSWSSLKITFKYSGKSKYHYTTIRKVFTKWSKLNIFKNAYIKFLNHYKLNIHQTKDDLFIDATFVNNKTGTQMVDINPMYYKKNVTKLSIICDSNKIPINIIPIKTKSYDGNTIIDSFVDVSLKRKTNLIADKGYIKCKTFKQMLFKTHKLKLITGKKKNQKNMRVSRLMKDKLRIRNKVENTIQIIKSFDRINFRKDKLIVNYMSFVYLAIGIKVNNKIK